MMKNRSGRQMRLEICDSDLMVYRSSILSQTKTMLDSPELGHLKRTRLFEK